jgi:hypothetical protein
VNPVPVVVVALNYMSAAIVVGLLGIMAMLWIISIRLDDIARAIENGNLDREIARNRKP